MRKLYTIIALLLLSAPASSEVWQARYGVAETFNFKLYNADGTLDVDEADGGAEVSLSCNEGAETTATNDFVDEGTFYSIALTATELQCERIAVVVAATTTEVFFVQTSGNASAMTPTYEVNLASATTGAIENQDFATAPGASGGLLISGSNAGTTTLGALTITGATTHTGATTYTGAVTMAAGLAITQSQSNTAGLSVTGNGTGNGATFTSGSGATGNGIAVTAASTNGNGLAATGTGTGSGLLATAGATGDGLEGIGGSTSGAGFRAAGTAGNSPAATLVGQGSAAGLLATGGATGAGISAVGGSTSGVGLLATGSAGNSAAMSLVGQGSGSGLLSTGGATGHGVRLVGGSTSGNGISTTFTAPSAGAPEFGFNVSGTLSGTHSSTTADLGSSAPGTVSDIVGHTLFFPTRNLSRAVTAYDTATGIATFEVIDADITLANADPWLLYATAPASGGGGGLDAAGVRTAIGLASANLDTQFAGVQSDTNDIQTRLPAALVSGRMDASAGAMAANVLTATAINADAFTAAKFASDVTTELQSGLATASALTTVSNNIGTPANLGGGATVAANLSDIEAQTDDIGAAGAGLTATDDAIMTRVGAPVGASISADIAAVESGISWNSAWDAEVESEASDALVAIHLNRLFAADYDPASKPGVSTALLNELIESDAGVSRFTANSLEQAPTGAGESLSAIADAVWDEALAGHVGVGSAGDALADAASGGGGGLDAAGVRAAIGLGSANLDTQLGTIDSTADAILLDTAEIGAAGAGLTALPWNSAWDAEVQSEALDALNQLVPTEPAAKPIWGTTNLAGWVAWIGMQSRNEINQTSTTKTIRNDADSANIVSCAVSDDGTTFSIQECTP